MKTKHSFALYKKVKNDSIGTVVGICVKNNKTGYIVEIYNEVFDFVESEIEVVF